MRKVLKGGPRTSSSTKPVREPQKGLRFSPWLLMTLCPGLAAVVTTNSGLDAPTSPSGARRPKGGCKLRIQETHLRRGALQDAVAAMRKVGFEMVGGEAFSTSRHGTNQGWCRRLDKNPPSEPSDAALYSGRVRLLCCGDQSTRSEPSPPQSVSQEFYTFIATLMQKSWPDWLQ